MSAKQKPKPVPIYFRDVLISFYKISDKFPTKFLLDCNSNTGLLFILNGKLDLKKYKRFKIVNYSIFTVGLIPCVYSILKPPQLINQMIAAIQLVAVCLQFVNIFIVETYSKDIISAFKNMTVMVAKIRTIKPKSGIGNPGTESTKINWRQLSVIWKNGYLCFACFIWAVMSPVAITNKIDPFFAIGNSFSLDENSALHIPYLGFVYLHSLVAFAEFVRLHGIKDVIFLYWFELQSKYLQCLEKQLDSRNFFNLYNQFRICTRLLENALNIFAYSVMTSLFLLLVLSNMLTVNFTNELPSGLNWVPPAISSVTFFVAMMLLPFIANYHRGTEHVIRMKERFLQATAKEVGARRAGKLELKILKSLRPVSIKCGSFYEVEYESVLTYFNGVIQRTVDGVLLTRQF